MIQQSPTERARKVLARVWGITPEQVGEQAHTCTASIIRAMIEFASQAAQPAEADGWVMVPREPTAEMLSCMLQGEPSPWNEGTRGEFYGTRENMASNYAAMLAATPKAPATDAGEVTVQDYNDAFDPADEAGGDAFRAGFREGWIFAQSPDGSEYEELSDAYGRAVDIEPSEAWDGYRDKFFAALPLLALPEIGAPKALTTPPAPNDDLRAENERLREALAQVAGKNDLSGTPDDELEAAARNALYDCELIALAALKENRRG